MARKSKEEKLLNIDEQIKRLQTQKKDLENKMKYNVGKAVFEEWEIDDEETALSVIKSLKEDVLKLLNKESILATSDNQQ